jgi:hypothetical protein
MSLDALAARYTVKTWSWIRVLLFTLGKPAGQNFLTIPHPGIKVTALSLGLPEGEGVVTTRIDPCII